MNISRFSRCLALLLIAIMALVSSAAEGQLRYGFRFGGVFADASLSHAGNFYPDNRSGFSGGLALEYQMPHCGFAPDIAVLYTRFNTRIKTDLTDPHSFGRNFLEVPLHLKYKFWLKSLHELFAPMVYTGPSLLVRLDHDDASPLSTKRMQPGWDLGIGFDIVNFIQISGGYRFGLGNAVSDFNGLPDARLRTNAWNVSATILFDF